MEDFDYNGLDTALNKYISLSYTMPPSWKFSFDKVAYILEASTLHKDRPSDVLLERLKISFFILTVCMFQCPHMRFFAP